MAIVVLVEAFATGLVFCKKKYYKLGPGSLYMGILYAIRDGITRDTFLTHR